MKGTLIAALCFVIYLFLNAIGGRIEGYFFPVMVPGEVLRVENVGEASTRIWGQSERLRNCSFDHLVWFLGNNDFHAPVAVVFEEGTVVRPIGPFEFGPWQVGLSTEQLVERSFAVAYHRCHLFWLTESRFYR